MRTSNRQGNSAQALTTHLYQNCTNAHYLPPAIRNPPVTLQTSTNCTRFSHKPLKRAKSYERSDSSTQTTCWKKSESSPKPTLSFCTSTWISARLRKAIYRILLIWILSMVLCWGISGILLRGLLTGGISGKNMWLGRLLKRRVRAVW